MVLDVLIKDNSDTKIKDVVSIGDACKLDRIKFIIYWTLTAGVNVLLADNLVPSGN
jgi:hypothetical protein